MRPVFPGATEKSQISHLPELLPLFERADCTAVKTAKAKEEDRTKIDPLEKSYVSTETGQVHTSACFRGRAHCRSSRGRRSPLAHQRTAQPLPRTQRHAPPT